MAGRPGGRGGSPVPYELLAGVVPISSGWLVASAKLQGIQMYPNDPEVMSTVADVLDYRPSFRAVALSAPIGLLDAPSPGGRACDREARRILGWPRNGAIVTPPTRPAVAAMSYREAAALCEGLSPVAWSRRRHIAEVDEELAPYRQRVVFEVQPELSFFQLNEDTPLRFRKSSVAGINERMAILKHRMQGIERVVDAKIGKVTPAQLLDAAVCLWTTRRIVARAMTRIPEMPEWDETGLRMELVR